MNLKLYYFPSCPYCQIVLSTISKLEIDVRLINIHQDPEERSYLYEKTGRYTVPCLFINEEPMHESYDIIEWLEKNIGRIKKHE